MIRSTAICAVAFAAAMGFFSPAFADDTAKSAPGYQVETHQTATDEPVVASSGSVAQDPVSTPPDQPERAGDKPDTLASSEIPGVATSIEHIDITVENSPLSVRSRRMGTDGVLIEASPIFTLLKGKVSTEGTVLSYIRFQDGATISIDMTNGKVSANGRILGALPDFRARTEADTWLSPNAIATLTGTVPTQDEAGRWSFQLVEQLKPKFELDLWVEGEQITNPIIEPRSIGSVLLIPLEVVTDALGHTIERESETVITVIRLQDSARITLDFSTGLVSVNNTPRGITPNIAFADTETLLLPFTAVETLTGTLIELVPGSARVDVRLDERLGGGVLPGASVVDEAAVTGFTPEALEFSASDRGPVSASFTSRFRNLNTELQYNSVGGFDNIRELTPASVTLNVQSLDGWVGSIGDTSTRFRELSGVSESRIRGVTWRRQHEGTGNLIALAAGQTANGSVAVTEDASRPDFGGFAAGARIISADRTREFGLSGSVEPGGDAGQIVVSAQKQITKPRADGETGLETLFVAADAGLFLGPDGADGDVRGRAQLRYRVHNQVGVQANLDYEGSGFSRPATLSTVPDFEGALTDRSASRFVGTVSTDWRAVKNWGPFTGVAAGIRSSYRRDGGPASSSAVSVSGSVNAQIEKLGLSLSLDSGYTVGDATNEDRSTTRNVTLRAQKRFAYGMAQATYTNLNVNGVTDQRLVANVAVHPITRNLGDGASLSFGPSASLVWTPEATTARLGATLSANSGQKFGDRFNLQGQISALQAFDPEQSGSRFFASLTSTFDITRNLQLRTSYVETFGGDRDFAIGLNGRVNFNAPRQYTRPKDGLGVLTGRVFFDRNRDGIRQPDEPGISGVRVQVSRTRLGLQVDRDGRFTIQNIKEGLYGLVVDRRSLALGLVVPDDVSARATIAAGRVTEIEIPVIASGQIRGTLFIDENGSGDVERGERRLEGSFITLRRTDAEEDEEDIVQLSASFGQFSFENLKPGSYEMTVNHKGIVHSRLVELSEDDLFKVEPFPLFTEDIEESLEFAADVSGVA